MIVGDCYRSFYIPLKKSYEQFVPQTFERLRPNTNYKNK